LPKEGASDIEGKMWYRVETTPTWSSQQYLPRGLVLDQEEKRMKFKKSVIVEGKPMNRYEMFV
jgi:hypothetical protein